MRKYIVIATVLLTFVLSGCASSRSLERSENPLNRSLLIDTGIKIGLDIPIIPIPLPKIDLNFHLHYRRPTPREEMELNLSKLGRQLEEHNQVPKDKLNLESAPAPFSARGKEKAKEEDDAEIRVGGD